MGDKLKQAQDYRTRAMRLRSIARDLPGQSERDLLMQLADEYDQMARSATIVARGEVSKPVGPDGADAAMGDEEPVIQP